MRSATSGRRGRHASGAELGCQARAGQAAVATAATRALSMISFVCFAALVCLVSLAIPGRATAGALPAGGIAAAYPSQQAQGGAGGQGNNPTVEARFSEQELRSAPGARDVWALLEHWVPAVVTERLDVGGSATGTQGLFSARSTTWQENVFRLEGVDMTDPAVRGTSTFFYDYDAFRQVTASWGTQPAGVQTGGVLVDMRLQSGGNEWHGAAQGYFEFDALQANNVSDELAAQGVRPASEIDYLSDASVQIGGPLAPGRANVFGSYRDLRISQAAPGFDSPVTTKLPIFTVKVDLDPTDTDDGSVFFSRQRYQNPARNAGPLIAAEATSREDSTFSVLGGSWSHSLGGGFFRGVRAGASFLNVDFPLELQPGATRQSRLDIVTRVRSGSAQVAINSERRRYAVDVEAGFGVDGEGLTQDGVFGFQFGYAPTKTGFAAIDDVNIVTSGGAPLLAQLLNTPVSNRQNARSLGLFVHDDLTIGDRWTVSLGLRYDDWAGSLPAQSSSAGAYAPAREFADAGTVIGWRHVAPRATVAFDVFGGGRLVIVAGYSQYVHQLGTSTLSFGNPNSLSSSTVSWGDANGDGQFQPGEGGPLMSVAGGAIGQIDPGLSAPLTRELRAGGALELGRGWRAHADFWYRKDDHLFDDVEVGLQVSDFAETVVSDPGRDNILGTGDDRGLIVFNQIDGFGDNQLLLTTLDEKTVTYKGVDIGVQRPWADNWELRALLTLSLAEGLTNKSGLVPGDAGGISDLFNDPNANIHAAGRMFWDRSYVLKVYGSYLLPHEVVLAGVLRSWKGAPVGRILPVPLNQGIVDVWAERMGVFRERALTTGDVRVSKELTLGTDLRLGLFADFFNISNAGTVVRSYDTFPLFGVPAEIVPPFVARFGARLGF